MLCAVNIRKKFVPAAFGPFLNIFAEGMEIPGRRRSGDFLTGAGLQIDLDPGMILLGVPHVFDGDVERLVTSYGGHQRRERLEHDGILPREAEDVLHRTAVREAYRAAAVARVGVEHLCPDRCREEVLQQLFVARYRAERIGQRAARFERLAQRFERVVPGEDQRHVAAVALKPVGLGRRIVDVGIRRHEQFAGVGACDGFGVELCAVHNFDAVDQPFAVGFDFELGVFEALAPPARMVVHHQRPLRLGVAERLQGVGGVEGVVVRGEKGVVVAVGDRFAGDLGAGNDRQTVFSGGLPGQFHREVQIRLDAPFVGAPPDDVVVYGLRTFGNVAFEEVQHLAFVAAVFHVFGDRQHVQTVVPRFADAEFGRAVAVGVDRVGVQVGFVDVVAVHLGQYEFRALCGDAPGVARDVGIVGVGVVALRACGACRRECGGEKQQFFHGVVVMVGKSGSDKETEAPCRGLCP